MVNTSEYTRSTAAQKLRADAQVVALKSALKNADGVTQTDFSWYLQQHTEAIAVAVGQLLSKGSLRLEELDSDESQGKISEEVWNFLADDYDEHYFEVAFCETMSRMGALVSHRLQKPTRK
eukprot:SAG11_NODE_17503_length_516_cov_1.299760_1_plen_120_part_10